MTSWTVRRGARYGHERWYAETPGGTALGYLDVKTGRFHSDDPSNLPLLERAIREHLEASDGTEPAVQTRPAGPALPGPVAASSAALVPPVAEPPAAPLPREPAGPQAPADPRPAAPPPAEPAVPRPAAPPPAEPAWVDLAQVPPGAAAQAQALAAREAQGRVMGFLARLFDVRTEERAWRIGAAGERAVRAVC